MTSLNVSLVRGNPLGIFYLHYVLECVILVVKRVWAGIVFYVRGNEK